MEGRSQKALDLRPPVPNKDNVAQARGPKIRPKIGASCRRLLDLRPAGLMAYFCFDLKSLTADLMASSASMEQCNLTGGKHNSIEISVFFTLHASSMFIPLINSVTRLLDAIALPQPNVLNFASVITPLSSTRICNFITSPHAGAPTSPVPTLGSVFGRAPAFLGFSKWSITFL
jgi:hypothetical protein